MIEHNFHWLQFSRSCEIITGLASSEARQWVVNGAEQRLSTQEKEQLWDAIRGFWHGDREHLVSLLLRSLCVLFVPSIFSKEDPASGLQFSSAGMIKSILYSVNSLVSSIVYDS